MCNEKKKQYNCAGKNQIYNCIETKDSKFTEIGKQKKKEKREKEKKNN